jgi:hypothetical protein
MHNAAEGGLDQYDGCRNRARQIGRQGSGPDIQRKKMVSEVIRRLGWKPNIRFVGSGEMAFRTMSLGIPNPTAGVRCLERGKGRNRREVAP